MSTISQKEYQKMVDELLNEDDVRFDTLCAIAEKHLSLYVKKWCKDEELAKDLMQSIQVKLMQSVVNGYLLKNGVGGKVNDDYEGFGAWIYTVARNEKINFLKRERKKLTESFIEDGEEAEDDWSGNYKKTNMDRDLELSPETIYGERIKYEEVRELIRRCFDIVLDSNIGIYKTLTWLALNLVILNSDVTKIESTEMIVKQFQQKTLFQMRDYVYAHDKKLKWLDISEEQKRYIDDALNATYDERELDEEDEESTSVSESSQDKMQNEKVENRRPLIWGDVKYATFFMKKGGKASVSDWVNKINKMIRRRVTYEPLN